MLSNTLVLADNEATPVNHSYDLVSRLGMESVRREVGVASATGSSLTIKNTVDLNAPNNKNRHLVQFSWTEIDATTGDLYPCSVHVVVSRHKLATDSDIQNKLEQMAALLLDTSITDDILIGGN